MNEFEKVIGGMKLSLSNGADSRLNLQFRKNLPRMGNKNSLSISFLKDIPGVNSMDLEIVRGSDVVFTHLPVPSISLHRGFTGLWRNGDYGVGIDSDMSKIYLGEEVWFK